MKTTTTKEAKKSDTSTKLLTAAESVLKAWERSINTPTFAAKAQMRQAMGDLYDAVLDAKEKR